MSKPIYVHLKLGSPVDLGTTYANHYIFDRIAIGGVNVTDKYLIVDKSLGSGRGWEYYAIEVSIDGESETRPAGLPGSTDGEKLYYDDPDEGQKWTWAWRTVYVDDSYIIPAGLDRTGLSGPFTFSSSNKISITSGSFVFDIVKYNLTQGQSMFTFGVDFAKSAAILAGNVLTGLGMPGLATAITNSQVAQGAMLTFGQDSAAFLGKLASGASDRDLDAAAEAFLDKTQRTFDDAFGKQVIIPGNPTADLAAHDVLRAAVASATGTNFNNTLGTANLTLGYAFGAGQSITISSQNAVSYIVAPSVGAVELVGSGTRNYLVGNDDANVIRASGANNYLYGGGGNDAIYTGAGSAYVNGGSGNDTIYVEGGGKTVIGGTGTDTVVLSGSISSYVPHRSADGTVTIGGLYSVSQLKDVELVRFADGTVNVETSTSLIDPFYYDLKNRDVLAAGVRTDTHYNDWGWTEGRDPNPYFSTNGYIFGYGDIRAAHVNPLQHYDLHGWKEGRDPSAKFDTQLYLAKNPDVAASGMDPLKHFLAYGQSEGRVAYNAIGKHVMMNGFDPEYYLLANPDVAAAGVDPYKHFQDFGWREGRNPNGWFDVKGYLAHYGDVAAAGINPLDHYVNSGWKEGRDPSATFSTSAYLSRYGDIVAAGVNPLTHFLQWGALEGRTAASLVSWAPGATAIKLDTNVAAQISGPSDRDVFALTLLDDHRYAIKFINLPAGSIDVATIDVIDALDGYAALHGVTARILPNPPGVKTIAPLFADNTFGFTANKSGIHRIVVGNGEQDAGGTYTFTITDVTNTPARSTIKESTDIGSTATSPFNLGSGATALNLGSGIKGEHSFTIDGTLTTGDHDMFKFVSPGGQIEITAHDPQALLDFVLQSTTGGSSWMTGLREVGATETSLILNLEPGTYLLDVSGHAAAPYHLDIFF